MLFKLTLFSALAASVSALTIATPASLTTCQPVLLSWSEGTPPFYPKVIPGSQPTAEPIHRFDTMNGTSVTWVVNVAPGTDVTIGVTDNSGATAWTSALKVQAGSSTSCVGTTPAAAPAANANPAPPANNSPATPPAGNTPAPAPAGANPSPKPVTSNAATTPAASPSASTAASSASRNGVAGAIVAAGVVAAAALY